MELDLTSATGALCTENIVVLQVGGDARDLFAIITSSLQSLLSHLTEPLPEILTLEPVQ